MRVKILGSATALTTTGSTISSSTDVFISHDSGGNQARTVTLTEDDGTVVGSYMSSPGTVLVINKHADQKLKIDAGNDVKATPVAYIS